MTEKKLFGTDGIRGKANIYPMTPEIAYRVGRAFASILLDEHKRGRVVIGKDTRISGYMIESSLTSGICSMGIDVLLTGPIPTTAVAFLTRELECDAGIVISASHNPAEDNGIKIFGRDGMKLSDELEVKIEHLIFSDELDSIRPVGASIGRAYKVTEARERYKKFLTSSFDPSVNLKGRKIVVDCANGAAYRTAPDVFRRLGAEVIILSNSPDGVNINLECGALHPGRVARVVVENKADLGIALDGDADRAILCDEKGQILDGDGILAVCGTWYAQHSRLPSQKVIATVMSNMGLDLALKDLGVEVIKTKVGDRYVAEGMREFNSPLGGEQSGHVIFSHYFPAGDGTLTAIRVLEIMQLTQKPLSELASVLTKLPQILINVAITERRDISTVPAIQEKILDAEKILDGSGRVLVRFSGTRPVARVMVEGKNEETIDQLAHSIAGVIRKELGNADQTEPGKMRQGQKNGSVTCVDYS